MRRSEFVITANGKTTRLSFVEGSATYVSLAVRAVLRQRERIVVTKTSGKTNQQQQQQQQQQSKVSSYS